MEHFYVTLLLLFLSLLSFTLFLIFHHHRSQYNFPNLPPGSPGLPYIGETLEFLSTGWEGRPEKFVFDRITTFSSQVFKTNLVGKPAVVLAGAAGNKFLFSNENKLVVAWWPDSVNKIFPFTQTTSSVDESRRMRKLLPNFLKPEALQRYIGTMDSIAQRHFSTSWEHKSKVLVFPLAKQYTFTLACRLFVSLEDPAHVARLAAHFNLVASGIVSLPLDLPGTPFRKAIRAARFIREELVEIIRRRKADLAEGKGCETQDILSHMLTVCDDETGEYMTELDIADKILGLLVGGHDTASAACTFVVKFLSELPHVYRDVYREQVEIAKGKGRGELLNWDDIQRMKYSWAVACEVMRLAPPLQGGFRQAISDFTFRGFFIPKGWKLYWSANSTHKSGEYFPDPDRFDPSRFQGSGPAPYTFVPFGGGPRLCPGKEYARLEILVFMHHLVKRFMFRKCIPDEKIVVDPMPIPAKGLPVHLFPHDKR